MSKSRLEKFLYALYSLDSSDLPTPLSRIEELYKCLVTGDEAPTFEPISRVEKYLMVILGGYDVDSLPNPLSRVEVLLYKLATGDDNLDDVKSFLSEHEELLAEIIRNGGVGGNIDIEYVLHTLSTGYNTLYNTAEKPVKSAILKGNTLVNVLSATNIKVSSKSAKVIEFNVQPNAQKRYVLFFKLNNIPTISDNSDNARLVKFEWYHASTSGGFYALQNKNVVLDKTMTIDILPYTGDIQRTNFSVWCQYYESGELDIDVMIIKYQEGIENWDIPYFEGMQSVKMPVLKTVGKNLFHGEIERGSYSANSIDKVNSDTTRCRSSIIPLIPDGFNGTISISDGFQFYLRLFKGTKVVKESGFTRIYSLDNTSNTFSEVTIVIGKVGNTQITDDELTTIKIQIEEGAVTEYEPHKSNILTVNEDVTLRSNGDVYDELNLLTGRLTQRIDENNEVLAQEVVKTVDLSVVNQDGNDTKLSTFNDITHVTLSSEGLIPEAELEVATKNEEVLNTMSLEMDDISATQTTLEETSNAQSENVDATMIATTEIYEELL